MTKLTGLTAAVSAAVLLGACGSTDSEMIAASNAFNETLNAGYVDLASSEEAEFDWRDSRHFAQKAVSAGADQPVEPDTLEFRDIPADNQDELAAALTSLKSSMGRGAAETAPVDAATAQVMFDCWMQEQEENHQPMDIARCRTGFQESMAKVDNALLSASVVGPYNVFFDFDKGVLGDDAGPLLATILRDIEKRPDAKVVVAGHADTSGSSGYNLALSEQRAEAVSAYLVANGVPAGAITKVSSGETGLLIPTADGVRNAQNRRVFIVLE